MFYAKQDGVGRFMEGLLGTVPRKGGAGREILAGLANALTLLSGLVVVPSLLFQAGMDFTGAYTACMLMTLAGTLLMGRLTGQPLVLAPGIAMASWLVYAQIGSQAIIINGVRFRFGFLIALIKDVSHKTLHFSAVH